MMYYALKIKNECVVFKNKLVLITWGKTNLCHILYNMSATAPPLTTQIMLMIRLLVIN